MEWEELFFFMIDDRLKELILPNLQMHLEKQDWKYIDEMFSEVYLTDHDGIERVTLKPHPEASTIAMQFATLNGQFIEITDWDYIKSKGRLV